MKTHAVVNGTYGAALYEYIHSSAKYYLGGENGFYPVNDAEDMD